MAKARMAPLSLNLLQSVAVALRAFRIAGGGDAATPARRSRRAPG